MCCARGVCGAHSGAQRRSAAAHPVAHAGGVAVAQAEGLPSKTPQRLRLCYVVLVRQAELAVRVEACGEGGGAVGRRRATLAAATPREGRAAAPRVGSARQRLRQTGGSPLTAYPAVLLQRRADEGAGWANLQRICLQLREAKGKLVGGLASGMHTFTKYAPARCQESGPPRRRPTVNLRSCTNPTGGWHRRAFADAAETHDVVNPPAYLERGYSRVSALAARPEFCGPEGGDRVRGGALPVPAPRGVHF